MHHPRRKPRAMPHFSGSVIPRLVDGFDGDRICRPHGLNRALDQSAANSLAPELFGNVHGIDNSDPAGLNDGRHGFPIADASDEKARYDTLMLRDEPHTVRLPE